MDERRIERSADFITIQPLQLLGGALFAFLLGAAFDALDRPALAATFGLLAIAAAAMIPLESVLVKISSPHKTIIADSSRALDARLSRIRYCSVLSFVIGATVTVVIGAWVK